MPNADIASENMVVGMEPRNNGRILAAELVGTAVLMLGGPGTARSLCRTATSMRWPRT